MEGFTDIHCHILPALDDGAKDMEKTRKMLQMAYSEGIRQIIATPHFYPSGKCASVEQVQAVLRKVQEQMISWNIKIKLYAGNEIFYHSEVTELLENGKVGTLAGGRYVLVEFDPAMEYAYLRDGVLKIDSYGYIPVLAHTERYDCLFTQKERLKNLKEQGTVIQVNASSLKRGLFDEIGKRARYLMKNDFIDVIGTDAHSDGKRSPKIREAADYLYKKIGERKAERILFANPRAILKDKDIR